MIFNSLTFLLFVLPGTAALYAMAELLMKERKGKLTVQNIILIVSSLAFFGWTNFDHIKVLLVIILLNYIIGIAKKRKLLIVGIILNIAILIYYKYMGMILSGLQSFFKNDYSDVLQILAPVGISFIIFHAISYLMDLYQGNAEPSRSLINFALYISFFPKLIQGPIVKYKDMKQELEERTVTVEKVSYGIERFIIGLAKKVLIADILAKTADTIFWMLPGGMDVGTAWIGTILFTLQIYFDFSGYSDMAIGLAKMFGFSFAENFNFPYRSKSVSEFWRRWHISLGAWFREYLYFPLGGNRKGNVYLNLFIVFMVTGIWHGAAMIYLLWGAAHGICVVAERYLQKTNFYKKIPSVLKWAVTMFIVNIGWICFKVGTVGEFWQYLKYMFGLGGNPSNVSYTYQYFLSVRTVCIILIAVLGIWILGNEKLKKTFQTHMEESVKLNVIKFVALLILLVVCYCAIVSSTYSPFLYFQY